MALSVEDAGSRRGRRHPPRRLDAAAAGARRRRRGAPCSRFFDGLSERSRYLRFHGIRQRRRGARRAVPRSRLGRARRARRRWLGRRERSSRSPTTLACAIRAPPRSPSPSPTTCRAAGSARACSSSSRRARPRRASSASSRRCSPRTRRCSRVFRDAGFEIARELERGEVEVRFPIAPTETLPRARRGARPRRRRRLAAAVLRAGERRRDRRVAAARLDRRRALPQHARRRLRRRRLSRQPDGEPVAGVRGYALDRARSPTRSTSPSSAFRASTCSRRRRRRSRKGVRALCVISAGFAEAGAEGAERQEQLLALVRAHGARLVGPNCLGIAVPRAALNATFAPRALPPGRIGFSSQSGALGLALLEKAARARPRLLGVRLDRQQGGRLVERPARVVGGRPGHRRRAALPRVVRQPAQVRAASPAASRAASRSSRSRRARPAAGARAASSHTAALAGSDAAVDALFRQAGVLRARTLEELVDAAALLSSQPLPRGRRVGVLTNAGGLGILCADACEAAGLELPELSARDARGARARCCRPRRASRTRSTCSARRPARRTSTRFRRCSPTRASTR